MNTQHTPGPWEVSNDHKPSPYIIRQDGRFTGFASVKFHDFLKNEGARQEQEANARLIASAPELLAALEKIADYVFGLESELNICSSIWMEARAAIAKATTNS
jgi:hypothetical protein